MTSLGNLPYIPAASDVADMLAHTQQTQQMLNHQAATNNNNGSNLIGLSMDGMQQQQRSSPTHVKHEVFQANLNIKQDYGLTAL